MLQIDGRDAFHLRSDDLLHDIAEFEYLLPLYEIVPGEQSLFLVSREKAKAATRK